MRAIFAGIVVVAVAYLGWVFYRETTRPMSPQPMEETALPAPPEPALVTQPAPPLPAPTGAKLAPPGVFYARERVSVQTATGVKALTPGAEVKLMYRYKDGKMRVTDGQAEFVVKPSVLTQDRAEVLIRR